MNTDNTILALRAELDRARAKFPANGHLFAALGEEVGELARELLEGGTRERIRAEAIQVACVAVRIADEGDGDFPASEPGVAEDAPCAYPGCGIARERGVHLRYLIRGMHSHDPSLDCHRYVSPTPAPVEPVAPSVAERNAEYRAEWEAFERPDGNLQDDLRCVFTDEHGALCGEVLSSNTHSHILLCEARHAPQFDCHPFELPEEPK